MADDNKTNQEQTQTNLNQPTNQKDNQAENKNQAGFQKAPVSPRNQAFLNMLGVANPSQNFESGNLNNQSEHNQITKNLQTNFQNNVLNQNLFGNQTKNLGGNLGSNSDNHPVNNQTNSQAENSVNNSVNNQTNSQSDNKSGQSSGFSQNFSEKTQLGVGQPPINKTQNDNQDSNLDVNLGLHNKVAEFEYSSNPDSNSQSDDSLKNQFLQNSAKNDYSNNTSSFNETKRGEQAVSENQNSDYLVNQKHNNLQVESSVSNQTPTQNLSPDFDTRFNQPEIGDNKGGFEARSKGGSENKLSSENAQENAYKIKHMAGFDNSQVDYNSGLNASKTASKTSQNLTPNLDQNYYSWASFQTQSIEQKQERGNNQAGKFNGKLKNDGLEEIKDGQTKNTKSGGKVSKKNQKAGLKKTGDLDAGVKKRGRPKGAKNRDNGRLPSEYIMNKRQTLEQTFFNSKAGLQAGEIGSLYQNGQTGGQGVGFYPAQNFGANIGVNSASKPASNTPSNPSLNMGINSASNYSSGFNNHFQPPVEAGFVPYNGTYGANNFEFRDGFEGGAGFGNNGYINDFVKEQDKKFGHTGRNFENSYADDFSRNGGLNNYANLPADPLTKNFQTNDYSQYNSEYANLSLGANDQYFTNSNQSLNQNSNQGYLKTQPVNPANPGYRHNRPNFNQSEVYIDPYNFAFKNSNTISNATTSDWGANQDYFDQVDNSQIGQTEGYSGAGQGGSANFGSPALPVDGFVNRTTTGQANQASYANYSDGTDYNQNHNLTERVNKSSQAEFMASGSGQHNLYDGFNQGYRQESGENNFNHNNLSFSQNFENNMVNNHPYTNYQHIPKLPPVNYIPGKVTNPEKMATGGFYVPKRRAPVDRYQLIRKTMHLAPRHIDIIKQIRQILGMKDFEIELRIMQAVLDDPEMIKKVFGIG